jgi:uncharacterized protein (TIGR02391 family)
MAGLVAHQCIGQDKQFSGTWLRVTRQGAAVAAGSESLLQLRANELLSPQLAPQPLPTARPLIIRGDYETAAFAAMKAVEVEVRNLSGLAPDLIGTKFMKEAFKQGGPLSDASADKGEQVATMNLFMGAIGACKNPASRRTVVSNDALEAAEVVQSADLLLQMLQRVGHRRAID